jgi:tetratricopeptide (TPR) repeat protein
MTSRLLHAFTSLVVALTPASRPVAQDPPDPAGEKPKPAASATAEPKALTPVQVELLDLAFRSVSAMPTVPHEKNRSRAQESVVAACLQLDQPRRALAYLEQIAGWRRGACYADLAFHLAERGDVGEVQKYLDAALRIADGATNEGASQEWRRDRIRAKVARTRLLLGQQDEAWRLQQGLGDSEIGQLTAAKAKVLDPAAFDAQVKALDAVLAKAGFDHAQAALQMCVRLFDRFFDDAGRRAQVEERVKSAYEQLPILARFELLLELADVALAHADRAKAIELLRHTQRVVQGATWLPEDRIALLASLVTRRARAGDVEQARKDADSLLTSFYDERDRIVDIQRGRALRPLAEAMHALGDAANALRVYKRAVEEGVQNPNSRPRADDLAATCLSMAVAGFEPDAELRARMAAVGKALGNPW